jgi:hypothetical protein
LLVVSAAVLLSFAWPSEHPEQVASGEFQHELATMVVRYLAKEPGTTPYGAATPAPSTP